MRVHRSLLLCGSASLLSLVLMAAISGCQSEDPDVDKGKSRPGKGAETLFLPSLEGWKFSGLKTYDTKTLYEPIDGEADRYLHYGFQKACFGSYEKEDGEGTIDIQVYVMDGPDNAYGIFSMYDTPLLQHGILGKPVTVSAASEGALDFAKGRYFVRISQHNMEPAKDLLKELAARVAEELDGSRELPDILSLLPDGFVQSSITYFRNWESYREINYDIAENVLNLSERTEGVQTVYTLTEDDVEKDKLLIVKYPDEKTAEETFSRFIQFFIDEGYETLEREENVISIAREGKPYARFSFHSSFIYGFFDISSEQKERELEILMGEILDKLKSRE